MELLSLINYLVHQFFFSQIVLQMKDWTLHIIPSLQDFLLRRQWNYDQLVHNFFDKLDDENSLNMHEVLEFDTYTL